MIRALKLAGFALDSQELIEREQNNIYKIGAMQLKDYLLDSPIICHGYAGLMALLTIEFKEQANHIIKEKRKDLADKIVREYNSNYIFGFKHTETIFQGGKTLKNESYGNDFLFGASGIILSLISLIKADTNWEIHLLAK